MYWKQKARIQWLADGDRNTKFFHASVKQKQRRNLIVQLRDAFGAWCSNATRLKELARQFYIQLYTKDPAVTRQPTTWTFPKLNWNSVRWLNREVTGDEVKRAMFDLGASKAPGPNGLPTCFFQKHWYWVGDSVPKFVLEVFRTGLILDNMNHAVICLLPKQ